MFLGGFVVLGSRQLSDQTTKCTSYIKVCVYRYMFSQMTKFI